MLKKVLKVGTRGSGLALSQAEIVAAELKKKHPGLKIETETIKTTGDKFLDAPLSKIGSKGLFTKEIEDALLSGQIDLAVHSLKDLTTEIPEGLAIGAVLKRDDPHDCLVSKEGWGIKTLPKSATVGTSALRRQAQVLCMRPDLRVENLRGNLDTRIQKLEEGKFDAVLVARAGLDRLSRSLSLDQRGLKAEEVPFEEILPAVGQGFLAIEIRADDLKTKSLVKWLEHEKSFKTALCERAFLRALEGGCQVPAGAFAEVEEDKIFLEGLIASVDGKMVIRDVHSGPAEDPEKIGEILGKRLLSLGGKSILETLRP